MHTRTREAMTKQEKSDPAYTHCPERIMHQMKSISQVKPSSLKAERELRGWSQSKIAELLGTTAKTVGRWERGEAVPYPHYREQLCTLFGKNAQQLGWLQEEDEQTVPMQDLKEMDAEPAIPQTLGKANQLLGRYDLFMQVKERLLAADSLALTGLLGVGKTTLAVAVAADQQVQNHFVDGILWAGLGPSANVLSQLIRWGKLLGVTPAQVGNIKSSQAWGQALRAVIGTRRLLLIIDDAWTAEDALALQVGGPGCAHLLTTYVSQVASVFAQRGSMVVPPLEDADGLALLASFIPQLVQQDPEGARTIVRAIGSVPLALTLMGKYLASQTLTGQSQSLRATLAQLYETQEHLRVTISTSADFPLLLVTHLH
jgi:transcriptional regulator with XRE-family HTH domain